MKQKPKYKPLLLTTTVRNPQRYKALLWLLKRFDGQLLNDGLAAKAVFEAIRYGLYRPMKVNAGIKAKWKGSDNGEFAKSILTDEELKYVIENNPQQHKEAGFEEGFPSRFATFFTLARTLGFVYYNIGEKIKFSQLGDLYAGIYDVKVDSNGSILVEELHPEYEQQVFLHAMCKFQRNNPFLRVKNENAPLILLLQTIKKLNADNKFNNTGISRSELPLLLFWKNADSQALYERIVKLREDCKYNPSDEIIADICINEIMDGKFKRFKLKSIVDEYPDDFIRKIRLTGLVSLRGGGRFIDINHNEDAKVDYILDKYSTYKKYANEKEYFNYVSKIDDRLLTIKSSARANLAEELLPQWLDVFNWETIKAELNNLSRKTISKDSILKFLSAPVRLEFLTAIAIKSRFPKVRVKPNYPCDDTGLPTSTAGGNVGDIECFESLKGVLVEVTMAEGRTQTIMEIWPIERHLKEFKDKYMPDSECIFIAPSIFSDSIRQCQFVKDTAGHEIRSMKIDDFISYMENSGTLHS